MSTRPVRGLLLAAALLALAGPSSVTASESASDAGDRAQLELLASGDRRVAAITYRLAAANGELCRDKAPLTGLSLHDVQQYQASMRPAAIALFGFANGPGVLAVAPGSPAESAGVRANDVLMAIGGRSVAHDPKAMQRRGSYERMGRVLDLIDAELAKGGPLTLDLMRGPERLAVQIRPVSGCASRVQLVPDKKRDAGADGRLISVTTGMADYARSDDELAVVIGHEMAHNALRHGERLKADGVARGLFSHFGKNASAIRQTEEEADRLGLFMLARAGYDIDAAPAFWRRFGKATDLGIFNDPTHPGWKRREALLNATIEEIRGLRVRNKAVFP